MQKALALDPGSTGANLLQMYLLMKKQDLRGALTSAEMVLAKDPDNSKALLERPGSSKKRTKTKIARPPT